jgi:hypothetical protein
MSVPYPGAPTYRFGERSGVEQAARVHQDLAELTSPRLHYQRYFCLPQANTDLLEYAQGLHDFLRAYFYMKSADWTGHAPAPLRSASAADLATMPEYYVMALDKTMPDTVAAAMPTQEEVSACRWLTDDELAMYAHTFTEFEFHGGLQWYRAFSSASSRLSCACLPARPSACRPTLSQVLAIGVFTKAPVLLRPCKAAHARTCV